MGKTIEESIQEVKGTMIHIDEMITIYNRNWILKRQIKNRKTIWQILPIGILLKIVPFNFPFWTGMKFVISNILVGNQIVMRPPECCLGTSENIESIIEQTKNLKDFLQVSYFDWNSLEKIISLENIKGLSFTGSVETGRLMGELAGKYLKRSVLELGGNDAFIVYSGDMSKIVQKLIQSKLRNMGQVCSAPKWIFIHQKLYSKFKEKLLQQLKENKSNSYMGNQAIFDWVIEQLKMSIEYGDKIIFNGQVNDYIQENRIKPTVMEIKDKNSILRNQEVFGPVFALQKFEDDEQLIRMVNSSDFGLGCSIFDENLIRAQKLAEKIQTGNVFINKGVLSNSRLPWGGIKNSGYGWDNGVQGISQFSNIKTIIKKINQIFIMNFKAHSFESLKNQFQSITSSNYDSVDILVRWSPKVCTTQNFDDLFNTLTYFKDIGSKIQLDLSDNSIPDRYMQDLGTFLSKHTNIRELVLILTANAIQDSGVSKICEQIQKMKNLKKLIIRLNWNFELTNKSLASIGKMIKNLQQLEFINVVTLPQTFITSESTDLFKGFIKENRNLSKAFYNHQNCFGYS